MSRAKLPAVLIASALIGIGQPASAQEVESFYRGRTVSLIVGAAPGGGYDLYARLIGRAIGRYIPGQPSLVVSNMPGAASNVAAAHIYNIAPKDGTVIGALYMGAVVEPLFGAKPRTTHDMSRFNYIGNANRDTYVCIARADAPAKSFAETFDREIVVGASSEGAGTRDFPTLLRNLLGARLKVVAGYPGTREINNAIEKGEVHGGCGQTWSSLAAAFPRWFSEGTVRVLAQEDAAGYAELNAKGIPLTTSFAKTPEHKQILDLIYSQVEFGRPYVVAPEVPKERVAALRAAFARAVQDPELQAEARRIQLDVIWTAGADLQERISRIYATPAPLLDRARQVMSAPH